jgi:homoserine kinase
VPATSANLGPGFDAFGLALGLYDEVEVALTGGGLVVEVVGARDVSRDEDNLVVRSIRAGFDDLGQPQPGLWVRCVSRIPHGRGLGSSAAAIVAGVVAARALAAPSGARATAGANANAGSADAPGLDAGAGTGSGSGTSSGPPGAGGTTTGAVDAAGGFGQGGAGWGGSAPDRAAVLRLAAAIEGHPDNVAAAIHGGFTVAWVDADGPRAQRVDPIAELRLVAFVPAQRQSTAASRGRLPAELAHGDAAFSAGRAGLLALALSQPLRGPGTDRAEVLLAATEDRLHQPFRLPAAPPSAELVGLLRAARIPAVLSGSGPTVLALAVGGTQAASAVSVPAAGFSVLPLAVDRGGVRVDMLGG